MSALNVSMGGLHVPPGVTRDDPITGCCAGEACMDPTHCTCWEPIYDLEQQPLENGGEPPAEIPTRAKCCHDCAYRNGSPERARGDTDHLHDLAHDPGSEFWCHQGVRRVVAFRHPDGRVFPAGDGDYRPPLGPNGPGERPVIWKADGSIGERCAGWAAHGGRS